MDARTGIQPERLNKRQQAKAATRALRIAAARIIDPSVASAPHPLGLTNNPEWATTRNAYAERECATIIAGQRAFEAEQRRTGSLGRAIGRTQLRRTALAFARAAKPYADGVISGLIVSAFAGVLIFAFAVGAGG